MAQLIINVPDEDYADFCQAFCDSYGYKEGTQTKEEFMKDQWSNYAQSIYQGWKIQQRMEAAKQPLASDTINIS